MGITSKISLKCYLWDRMGTESTGERSNKQHHMKETQDTGPSRRKAELQSSSSRALNWFYGGLELALKSSPKLGQRAQIFTHLSILMTP